MHVHHEISFRFAQPVRLGPQTVRLWPRVPLRRHSLHVVADKASVEWAVDAHSNMLAHVKVDEEVREFGVVVNWEPHALVGPRQANDSGDALRDVMRTLDTSGVCRDVAWRCVAALRRHGADAYFVSGYLIEADRIAMHAWCTVGVLTGWVHWDPTRQCLVDENYVPVAVTPCFEDAAPVSGTSELTEADFSYKIVLS